jgi:Na+/H+ antiporter NhaD/arsenite permease-like protein
MMIDAFTSTLAFVSDAAPTGGHDVSTGVTVLFIALLVAMVAALAFEEKLHAKKSIITSVFAVVCLLLGAIFDLLPFEHMQLAGGIHLPVYIPAIEWEVIAIILGASLFVDVTSKSGIFSWIAIRLTKASGGDPVKLLWYYCLLTVPFSAVLNNVTAMIIIGSLTSVSLAKLDRRNYLLGFLLAEGLLTNVGGLLTLISSVPNIIVGQAAEIGFMTFFIKAAPYVVIATIVTIWLARRLFKIEPLTDHQDRAAAAERVAGFDENDGVPSRGFFVFSAVALVLLVAAFSTASIIPYIKDLGLGFVAMFFAVAALLKYRHDVDKFYAAVDWDLLAFFGSLFIVINVMEHAQVLAVIGKGLAAVTGLGAKLGPIALLWCSGIMSSVTDNIPLSAMLAKIFATAPEPPPNTSPLWWAIIFGCNLGGNISPIGSASTVVAVTIIHRNKLPLSFVQFVKSAAPFAAAQLFLASVYLFFFLS